MKSPLLLLFALLAAPLSALADNKWRTFENADKTKSFVGRLVGYDMKHRIVTVQKKSTMRPVRFKITLLSDDNRQYVKDRAMELEAAGGLRMMFHETVEKLSSNRTSTTRTASYNGGFKIEIRNFATKLIDDVEVDYIMVYRKDSTKGLGEVATIKGSQQITTLVPNLDEVIVADGIPLKSYFKAGSVSFSGST